MFGISSRQILSALFFIHFSLTALPLEAESGSELFATLGLNGSSVGGWEVTWFDAHDEWEKVFQKNWDQDCYQVPVSQYKSSLRNIFRQQGLYQLFARIETELTARPVELCESSFLDTAASLPRYDYVVRITDSSVVRPPEFVVFRAEWLP